MRAAGVVVDTWKALAAHARAGCCVDPVAELRQVPDAPAALYDRLCPDARELFTAWEGAKHALPAEPGPADVGLAGLRERRAVLGLEGMGESVAQLRARAIDAMPHDDFMRLLALPAGRRAAHLEALERGVPSRGEAVETPRPAPGEERVCPQCGARFVPDFERQRYCTPRCRQAAYRERQNGGRASLEPTE